MFVWFGCAIILFLPHSHCLWIKEVCVSEAVCIKAAAEKFNLKMSCRRRTESGESEFGPNLDDERESGDEDESLRWISPLTEE